MKGLSTAALGWALLVAACASTETAPPTTTGPSTTTTTVATTRPVIDPNNFSMSDLTNGPPLQWSSTLSSDMIPVDALMLGDRVFVLATSASEGGLSGWTSVDGVTWEETGQIVPGGTEIATAATIGSQLLVASRPAPGDPPIIYSTEDGETWVTDEIPFESDNPFAILEIRAMGGNESLIVVSGEEIVDPIATIGDRLAEAVLPGADISRSSISMRPRNNDALFEVVGPMGFVLGRAMATELDLSVEDSEWLRQLDTNRADLFIKSSGGVWQQGELEGSVGVISIASDPSGEIVATGVLGQAGTAMWTSFEGLSWERVPTLTERPWRVVPWQDRLVGPSATANGVLLVSDGASTWMRSGMSQYFPASPQWGVSAIGPGDAGLVVALEAFVFPERGPSAEFDPVVIERDGLSVVATNGGLDIIEDESGVVHSFFSSDPSIEDSLTIDLTEEMFTFFDDDGEKLLTLTFDELWALEEEWDRTRFDVEVLNHALAYTTDTSEWLVWDLEDIRSDIHANFAALAQGNVVVVLGNEDHDEGFEIWTAPLP